jgi:tetratricopeptide (TPR) repeat protein
MKRIVSTGFLGFIVVALIGCAGPAQKAFKSGEGMLEVKDYYGASKAFISALQYEPDFKEAKIKLCGNAKAGYEYKHGRAEEFEKSANYDSALGQYGELQRYVHDVDKYGCLNFVVANLENKIKEMKSGASEADYREAEAQFNAVNYDGAISKYKRALSQNNPYKDSTEKIAECYYRLANGNEKQGVFRTAAQNYLSAMATVSGYKDSLSRAVSIYDALGDHYMTKKMYRNAYDDYSEVRKIDPQYTGITEKIAKAEEAAVIKIAFVKFDNKAGKDLAGASLNDVIGDEFQVKLKQKASHFLKFMDREQLESILGEQSLGREGLTDDYSSFKKLKGVNYLVFGKLNQVNLKAPGKKSKNYYEEIQKGYACIKTNKKGQTYEDTCYQKAKLGYVETSASISLTMGGSFKLLNVASGEQTINTNFNINKADQVKYATDFSEDLSQVNASSGLVALAKERQELSDDDTLMKQVVDELTNDAVSKILAKLDTAQSYNDPVSLKLKR